MVDRRVRKTKLRLKEALTTLIHEKDYDAISVRDITDRADVGRSTFYSHFDSKEELLFDGFDRWLVSLAERPVDQNSEREAGETFRFSRPLFEHMKGQRRFFEAIIVRGSNARIRRKTIEMLVVPILREIERMEEVRGSASKADSETVSREARAHAIAGAFLGIVSWWLDRESRGSIDVIDGLFQSVVTGSGIRSG